MLWIIVFFICRNLWWENIFMQWSEWISITLSYIFESVFKMLTGQKFENWFLSGFPISTEATRAVFAKLGKMLCYILKLIDLVESVVKKSTGTFISFGGMVSLPVAFLEFCPCISFFILISLTKWKQIFYLHEMKFSRYFSFAIY